MLLRVSYIFLIIVVVLYFSILLLPKLSDSLANKESKSVDVRVVKTEHIEKNMQVIMVGKVLTVTTRPEEYNSYLKYKDKIYQIEGKKSYDLCKKNKNKIVHATLTTYSFANYYSYKKINSIVSK